MASVTEDSLNLAAHQVVAKFVDDGVSLNEGVRKKASELGLNRDQTARLIERTNSEAFLRVFPETTDFEVADPGVLLGGSEKVASEDVRGRTERKPSYAERLDRDFDEIFGNTQTKTASYDAEPTNSRQRYIDVIYNQRIEEELRVEKTAKLIAMEDAEANLWNVFKTAACNGTPVAHMERDLMFAFPDKLVTVDAVVDALTEKLAHSLLAPEIMKRAGEEVDTRVYVPESPIICAFQAVIDVVG